MSPHEPEGVPGLRVSWIAAQGFSEPRLGELGFAPTRGAQTPGQWPERILRRHLRGSVVLLERLVVAVCQLERVSELDPRDGARRSESLGQRFSVALSPVELP